MSNDYGSNQSETGSSKRSKQAENFGIGTLELPNGQRFDGYLLLGVKNCAKLGVNEATAREYAKAQKKAVIGLDGGIKLHVQFGDREVAVAAPVEMTFV